MTLSPGFANPVHEAQQTFRQLLMALAHPGQIYDLAPSVTPPAALTPATAAACLTLLDLETTLWLPPTYPDTVATWLAFHTGVRRSPTPQAARFAILDLTALDTASPTPSWTDFFVGTAPDPESACTLLLPVPQLTAGEPVTLRGPGIQDTRTVAPQLPATFWPWWADNHAQYPLGVDVFLFSPTQVMGLPRSVAASASEG
ncbi:MAG: phosphonate C-P lyase system protein PhnH [Cyanobacteria bacterium J06632_22]